jgi:serine/threonine protein kinase
VITFAWFVPDRAQTRLFAPNRKYRRKQVENVLFDKNWNTKLTDFGFARECYDPKSGNLKLSETFCGTEPYYAPEIIEREPYNCFLADVWATGVVLFAMLNNKFPFHFKDLKGMLKEQYAKAYKWRPELERELSKDVKDLQSKMFEPDVNKRITMAEVVDHPWIKKRKK